MGNVGNLIGLMLFCVVDNCFCFERVKCVSFSSLLDLYINWWY